MGGIGDIRGWGNLGGRVWWGIGRRAGRCRRVGISRQVRPLDATGVLQFGDQDTRVERSGKGRRLGLAVWEVLAGLVGVVS